MKYIDFDRKVPIEKNLIDFGFSQNNGKFSYCREIMNGQFSVTIEIVDNMVKTKTIDLSTGDLYTLHLIENIQGAFVGKVRAEFNKLLEEIANKCFEEEIFKNNMSKFIIRYIKEKYDCELEFLWKKLPDYAVMRRKDTGKWFGIIFIMSEKKLGINSNKFAEMIDLRMESSQIESTIDNKHIFHGYHMNKKHWITILPYTITEQEIIGYIDQSYLLAK